MLVVTEKNLEITVPADHSVPRTGVILADGAGVIFARLHLTLQELDHDGLGQVAGRSAFSKWGGVVEGLHAILDTTG